MTTSLAPDNGGFVIPAWTFADRLRKVRLTTGLDQRAFAAQLSYKSSAYAQWEAGNAKPRDIVGLARRVEFLTRVPAAWLLDIDQTGPVEAVKDRPSDYSGVVSRPVVNLFSREDVPA